MDRSLWQAYWAEDDWPSLPCPTCGAPLNFDGESLRVNTSQHMLDLFEVADVDDVEDLFQAWMICGRAKCREVVSVSGRCTYSPAYDEAGATITERTLHPKALVPGPPLIDLTDDVPNNIHEPLDASFQIFWADYNACAGQLRIVLENILTSWGYPRETTDGKFVSLHQRITAWESVYGAQSIAKSLMAIKWLGNVGAHPTPISCERLLDAYEILERVVRQLYPPDERHLDDLADEIVQSKGQG